MRTQSYKIPGIQIHGRRHLALGLGALVLMVVAILMTASTAAAAATSVYIAQNSAGAANGADCADAYAYTFFNSTNNWPGTIGPGTTVYLCGTIGAGAGNTVLFVQGSGSSGSPITIMFTSGSSIQAPYFAQGGAIQIYGYNYITVNGGTNGFIKATANGTGQNAQDSQGVYVFGSNDIIENLTIENMYLRTSTSDLGPAGLNDSCIQSGKGTNGQTSTNLTITNNILHDCGLGIDFQIAGSASGYTASNNTIYNVNWAMDMIAYGGNYDSMYIFGNHTYGLSNWDNPGTDAFHHNAIHMFQGNNSSATISHMYIYNNEFDGPVGDCCVTAQIYVDNNGTSLGFTNSYVFNNIFSWADGDCTGTCGNGQLDVASGSNWTVANNTFIGDATNATTQQGDCLGFYSVAGSVNFNSLYTGCVNQISTAAGASFTGSSPDYNLYANSGGQAWQCQGTFFSHAQLSSWQSCVGNELHSAYFSSSVIPTCNSNTDCSNVRPATGSSAVGFGTNLFNTCNGQPVPGLGALCYDKPQSVGAGSGSTVGNQRPNSGAWTAGAYSSGGSGQSASQPAPPSGLTATVTVD